MWALFPTEQEICGSKGVPEKGWPFGYDIKEILAMMVKDRSESPGSSDDPVSGDEGDEDDVRLSGGDDDDAEDEDEDEGEGMDVDRRCAALAVNADSSCRWDPGR